MKVVKVSGWGDVYVAEDGDKGSYKGRFGECIKFMEGKCFAAPAFYARKDKKYADCLTNLKLVNECTTAQATIDFLVFGMENWYPNGGSFDERAASYGYELVGSDITKAKRGDLINGEGKPGHILRGLGDYGQGKGVGEANWAGQKVFSINHRNLGGYKVCRPQAKYLAMLGPVAEDTAPTPTQAPNAPETPENAPTEPPKAEPDYITLTVRPGDGVSQTAQKAGLVDFKGLNAAQRNAYFDKFLALNPDVKNVNVIQPKAYKFPKGGMI